MEYNVVIPAAGSGTRMEVGQNKLFLKVAGQSVIAHTLRYFEEDDWCKKVILVGKPEEFPEFKSILKEEGFIKVQSLVSGGTERQESVKRGLDALDGETIVLIHDGARPLIDKKLIHQLVQEVEEVGAAILAVPMKDTIKREQNGKIVDTLDRDQLWAAQTPQGFRLPVIKSAHEQAIKSGFKGTDDASLLEDLGQEVAIVKGNYRNIKVTTPEDLVILEYFITGRES